MIRVNRWLLPALLMYGCTPADGAIYRCIDEPGAVLYSQFPCANAELVPERQVSVIDTPQFSESERLMLKHIEQNSLALKRASLKRAKQKHRQREMRKTNETALCRQALVGIANLRARKRAGYSLSEATALWPARDRATATASAELLTREAPYPSQLSTGCLPQGAYQRVPPTRSR